MVGLLLVVDAILMEVVASLRRIWIPHSTISARLLTKESRSQYHVLPSPNPIAFDGEARFSRY
jgi:hypothetical protein